MKTYAFLGLIVNSQLPLSPCLRAKEKKRLLVLLSYFYFLIFDLTVGLYRTILRCTHYFSVVNEYAIPQQSEQDTHLSFLKRENTRFRFETSRSYELTWRKMCLCAPWCQCKGGKGEIQRPTTFSVRKVCGSCEADLENINQLKFRPSLLIICQPSHCAETQHKLCFAVTLPHSSWTLTWCG